MFSEKGGCLLTLGSLFDGIGVFPLAGIRYGIIPLWASEIEKAPISITKRHFPDMVHLGDITKLDGGKVPPVHIVAFGSPCQNLSIAGNRKGLSGIKSSLFFEAIRIIEEMREATNGIYPTFAVWENVMGAFSANHRMDFKSVLESFANAEIPMPPTGKWANAGMVRGCEPDICWRLMDAQYWGEPSIPQRRKRIFLVADFRGQRAREILFKSRRLLPNIETCGNCRMSATFRNRISSEKAGRTLPVVHPFQNRRMREQARKHNKTGFVGSFGKSTDPFTTLLAGDLSMFSLWYGNYKNGLIRHLTPTECERLMGLPEGWTVYSYDGKEIKDTARYKALGNAIVLPCAEYIMSGIADVLKE